MSISLMGLRWLLRGDAVYSMYIRRHLILKGMTKPNKLHQEATKYVSAKAQARLIALMLEQQVLTEKKKKSINEAAIPIVTQRLKRRCRDLPYVYGI